MGKLRKNSQRCPIPHLDNDFAALSDEWALRERVRAGFEDFARCVLAPGGEAPAGHHLLIIAALQSLAATEGGRLMLLMPPGSAKSTYASVLFPAWFLARQPKRQVILVAHTAALAADFGRRMRDVLVGHAARLDLGELRGLRGASRLLLDNGSSFLGVGVSGAVTGRRADLAIIDDPIRGLADVSSRKARQRLWDWYGSELVTRLRPGGRVLLVMTRWHIDDLAGRLIAAGGFEVLALPALADPGDLLGRRPGEALWPAYESRDAVMAKKKVLGEAMFAAQFQQAPLTDAGAYFDVTKIRVVDSFEGGRAVRAWDLAASEGAGADWTVGIRLQRDRNGVFLVDDIVRVRAHPIEVWEIIAATATRDGHEVEIGLPVDPGQAGRSQIAFLTSMLAGFVVRSSPEIGAKAQRAMAVAAQAAVGNLVVRRAAWNAVFFEEIALFPAGPHDDQVDALARGFGVLAKASRPATFSIGPSLAR